MSNITQEMIYIQDCKYINPETQNAKDMLNNCSNKNNFVDKILIDYKLKNMCNNLNNSINTNIIEGYSNQDDYYDHFDDGPGESYVPEGSCPCGFVQNDKGECVKIFIGCFKTTNKYFNNHHLKKTSEKFNMGDHTLLNNRHMYTNNCSNVEEDLNEDKGELKQEIYGTDNIISTFIDKLKELVN
jgi:hypothetical protein